MALLVLDHIVPVRSVLTARRLAPALALSVGLWAAPADAHITLLTPAARYSPDQQKNEPCGAADNPPGNGPVATYQAGETITVVFDETVDHGGHFRVALDPTGTDAFTSPAGFDDFYNSPEVLLDEIPDGPGGMYSIEVTLPDVPCNPCTLQLIQVMYDAAWGPGTSDLYFQCSDIVIEGSAAESGSETGADGTGGEASSGDGDVGSTGSDPDGGPAGSEGGSTGGGGSEGEGSGDTGLATGGTSGPADSDDDASGCSCRTDDAGARSPLTAAPWLFVALVAWRRRRSRA